MDDRLDHLLINANIRDHLSRIHYVPNSYTIFGQDGIRFNQSITNPPNTVVPSSVSVALYGMSDHLPITASLALTPSLVSAEHEIQGTFAYVLYPNPVSSYVALKNVKGNLPESVFYEIIDIAGRTLYSSNQITWVNNETRIPVLNLLPGVYTLKIHEKGEIVIIKKFIKS
jgi:hypothetical protein